MNIIIFYDQNHKFYIFFDLNHNYFLQDLWFRYWSLEYIFLDGKFENKFRFLLKSLQNIAEHYVPDIYMYV